MYHFVAILVQRNKLPHAQFEITLMVMNVSLFSQRIKKYPDEIYELPPIKKSRKQVQTPNMEELVPKQEACVKEEEVPLGEFRLNLMFRVCNDKHQTETPSRHAGQEHEMLVCCGCGMKGMHLF